MNIQKKLITKNSQNGIATIELALILPILMLVTFTLIELGFGLWNYNTLAYSVREGARYAAVNSSVPNVVNESKDIIIAAGSGLNLVSGDINISWNPNQRPGSTVTVTTTYNHLPFTGYSISISMTSTTSLIVSR